MPGQNPNLVQQGESLFHSVGEAIAKPCLPMTFMGRTEERESQYPRVRLLDLIKDDKYEGWENLIVLNVVFFSSIITWILINNVNLLP